MSGSGPIYEYQRELTARLEQAFRERDEARAEVERLREQVAQLRGALHGQSAVAFAVEHVAKGKVAGADALRTVAERQREACADFLSEWIRGKNERKWTGPEAVRATPLVTEGDE